MGFESLRLLLETGHPDIIKFIPVFVIPVIKNIQYSHTIYQDNKAVTLLLA